MRQDTSLSKEAALAKLRLLEEEQHERAQHARVRVAEQQRVEQAQRGLPVPGARGTCNLTHRF